MEKFTALTSPIIPLPRRDVDTDLIIPAQYLTSTSRKGYGENLFRRLRDSDPKFPLNLSAYQGASILVADDNFGCGSSREHAVWALQGAGIRAVISKSFADIFAGNSAKNGLLLVSLKEQEVDTLLERAKADILTVTVDLEKQEVVGPEFATHFEYDPFRKHCLLEGLEDIDYLFSQKKEIAHYRKSQAVHQYFSTVQQNNS